LNCFSKSDDDIILLSDCTDKLHFYDKAL
jgi:hypothetical protein